MSDQYIGEIRAFAFNFAPPGWALCNGQLLSVNINQELFSLLQTTYGGDGINSFALPDLRGCVAISFGTSPFGTPRVLGQQLGEESHALTINEMPSHQHLVAAASNGTLGASNVPDPTVILGSGSSSGPRTPAVPIYAGGTPNTPMVPFLAKGGNQPHENRMPFLTMSYCIALSGTYPPRS